MGASSSPPFNGTTGQEPPDPRAGKPGHFAWARWVKSFLKSLDQDSVKRSGDTMTGPLLVPPTTSGDPDNAVVTKSYLSTITGTGRTKWRDFQ